MRILHTIAGLWEGTGGPVESVSSLCLELSRRGHEIHLLTGAGQLHPRVRALEGVVAVRQERLGPYALAHWSHAFRSACRDEALRADIVHDHGVWLHTNWSSAWSARRAGTPHVRSPRGMLSPWAMGRRPWRKRLLWHAIEQRLFAGTDAIHVTSDLEAQDVRAVDIGGRIEVIPNGIDTDGEYAAEHIVTTRAGALPSSAAGRTVLFLSRIHPKKGLDLLSAAWSSLPPRTPATLVIAGDGGVREVSAVASWVQQQTGPPARYVGPVSGDEKVRLLASAWVLVLPSRSENYGMAVAEALACGTPVIASTQTPWRDLDAEGCGRTVEPRVDALVEALRGVLSLGDAEHQEMRHRARRLIEERHSLRATGARFEALYHELVNAHQRRADVP